jgi:hypothetical protein
MSDLVINVSWEYFLGIVGSIVALAYYASGRFSRLETSVDWLSEAVRELSIKAENVSTKLFAADSPVSLTPAGRRCLEESGLKLYIDLRKPVFMDELGTGTRIDICRIQDAAFRLLGQLRFDDNFAWRLNRFAFENGVSTDLLRRVGAIYLRDIVAKRI